MDKSNFRPNHLTSQEINCIAWAIRNAEVWRGSLVGNPNPKRLEQFDKDIKHAKQGMRKLRKLNNYVAQSKI